MLVLVLVFVVLVAVVLVFVAVVAPSAVTQALSPIRTGKNLLRPNSLSSTEEKLPHT